MPHTPGDRWQLHLCFLYSFRARTPRTVLFSSSHTVFEESTMPTPRTPQHSRHSSAVDGYQEYTSPRRRQSQEPDTPSRNNLRDDTLDLTGGERPGEGGMGNLADELADAFSESGDDDMGDEDDDNHSIINDDDQAVTQSPPQSNSGDRGLDPNFGIPSRSHRKMESNSYDGSEFGSEPDYELPGISPGLLAKIDAIESLARRGTENYGGSTDDAVRRVTEALRDLGSQSSIEASASR